MEEFLLPCVNKEVFGLDCYGCGGQRSLLLLLDGDFVGAFHMFPALYTLIILLIFVFINFFYKFKYDFQIKIALVILNAGILLINYLLKMYQLFN